MRFLLIDKITEWELGRRASAVKCVALSEDFFEDHFPTKPLFPGALIIEGMAQLSGVLVEESVKGSNGLRVKALLSIIEKAKFRGPVQPGDRLEYEASVLSVNEAGARVSVTATVDGATVGEAILTFTFHEFSNPKLEARRTEVLSRWLEGLQDHGTE